MRWRDAWVLLRESIRGFIEDKASRLGAAMAFYTALSLAPLLLAVVGIVGLVYGEQAARGEIALQIASTVGAEQAELIQRMLAQGASSNGGILSTILGVVLMLYASTRLFAELQDALDAVWNVPPQQQSSGVLGYIQDRLLSFSMVFGTALLLIASLIFNTLLAGFGETFESWLPYSAVWLRAGSFVILLLLTTMLFAMIYKVLPHIHIAWSDVWIGAAVTALLFNVGILLIGLYLGRTSVGSTFGAAGSFVVMLVWIYYSTQIVLLGAEFTQVYASKFGSGWNTTKR